MTVKELIDKLLTFDQSLPVLIWNHHEACQGWVQPDPVYMTNEKSKRNWHHSFQERFPAQAVIL